MSRKLSWVTHKKRTLRFQCQISNAWTVEVKKNEIKRKLNFFPLDCVKYSTWFGSHCFFYWAPPTKQNLLCEDCGLSGIVSHQGYPSQHKFSGKNNFTQKTKIEYDQFYDFRIQNIRWWSSIMYKYNQYSSILYPLLIPIVTAIIFRKYFSNNIE